MTTDVAPELAPQQRRRLGVEVWIVLGLTLGRSAVYAVLAIIDRLTADTPLRDQTTAINTSASPRPYVDLVYQLVGFAFALVPVALALFLLSEPGRSVLRRVGLDRARPLRDLGWGFALAAAVGLPGLAFYAAGRAMGITVQIQASALDEHWWAVPVLILAALKNALVEEVIVVAYLMERLRDLRWGLPAAIATSAVLRGAYHLYQGVGPFFGNIAMGVLFAWFYQSRWGRRRVMPLVVAHTLMDVVAFVGYALLPFSLLEGLGLA